MERTTWWFLLVTLINATAGVVDNRIGHGLTSIPGDIATGTTDLFLGTNFLTTLEAFPALGSLTKLYVDQNLLTEFPDLSVIAGSLTNLNLANNLLTEVLPFRLNVLTGLRHLKLSYNLFSTYPDVPGITGVYYLYLDGNMLETVPEFHYLGSGPVQLINLQNNRITVMSERAAQCLPNLQKLELSSNLFTEFPPVLDHMTGLVYLKLDDNDIHDLPEDIFLKLNQLTELKLGTNQLKTLPNMCHAEDESKQLLVESNPLACDCRLKHLVVGVASGKLDLGATTCSQPSHLAGRLLSSLTMDELQCDDPFQELVFAADRGLECGYPNITETYTDVSPSQCGALCRRCTHCFAFGFEPVTPGNMEQGNCGISIHGRAADPALTWSDYTYHFSAI